MADETAAAATPAPEATSEANGAKRARLLRIDHHATSNATTTRANSSSAMRRVHFSIAGPEARGGRGDYSTEAMTVHAAVRRRTRLIPIRPPAGGIGHPVRLATGAVPP